jgi:hypothetical protein
MIKVAVTYDGRRTIEQIQKEFERQLSPQQIRKVTAISLNDTARRSLSTVRKEIRADYTVSNKYLSRMARLSRRASPSSLYAEISYSYMPVPLAGFRFKDKNKRGFVGYETTLGGVQVEIKAGQTKTLRHAFVKKMKSGHVGVWAHGHRQGKRYVFSKPDYTKSKKPRIFEMKTASPFTMAKKKEVERRLMLYIQEQAPKRLRGLLQSRVDKLIR